MDEKSYIQRFLISKIFLKCVSRECVTIEVCVIKNIFIQ